MHPTVDEQERVEAVIITGPRKGEIVLFPETAPNVTPEAEAELDAMIRVSNEILTNLRTMRSNYEALNRQLQQRREKRDELLRSLSRNDTVAHEHQPGDSAHK